MAWGLPTHPSLFLSLPGCVLDCVSSVVGPTVGCGSLLLFVYKMVDFYTIRVNHGSFYCDESFLVLRLSSSME